jgi:hypothetical protein
MYMKAAEEAQRNINNAAIPTLPPAYGLDPKRVVMYEVEAVSTQPQPAVAQT